MTKGIYMSHFYGKKHGCKGTFVVRVEHCQNESWQGEVLWAEEDKREKFRSTLELIKLMDEAVRSEAALDERDLKQG